MHDEPDLLWHYTTQEGLLGIIGSEEVWATHILYLNDDEELRFGLKVVLEVISQADGQPLNAMLVELHNWLIEVQADLTLFPATFVFSLTEKGDLLSQWRGYTQPGNGFSIGFDSKWLATRAASTNGAWHFGACFYGVDRARRYIMDAIEGALALARKNGSDERLRYLRSSIVRIVPLIKHEAFDEEREWRLVIGEDHAAVRLRTGTNSLIPYVPVHLIWSLERQDPPVFDVIVGPGPSSQRSMNAVRAYLHPKVGTTRRVMKSEVPFRPW